MGWVVQANYGILKDAYDLFSADRTLSSLLRRLPIHRSQPRPNIVRRSRVQKFVDFDDFLTRLVEGEEPDILILERPDRCRCRHGRSNYRSTLIWRGEVVVDDHFRVFD